MVLVVREAELVYCLVPFLLAGADLIVGALINKPSEASKEDPFDSWTGRWTWLVQLKRCCDFLIAAFGLVLIASCLRLCVDEFLF